MMMSVEGRWVVGVAEVRNLQAPPTVFLIQEKNMRHQWAQEKVPIK